MPIRQKIVAIFIAVSIFILIFELVRRRKLREEYSWLWLMTGVSLIILVTWYGLLIKITSFIGAVIPLSTLFFLAIIFLMLVCLQFSVKVSKLMDQVKNLGQELAIMRSEIENKEKGI